MELKFKHLVFLQVMDVITTFLGLTYFRLREANPIANYAFNEYGLIESLLIMKIVGLIIIFGAIMSYGLICKHAHIGTNPLNIKKLALNIICFMFVLVVMNNLYRIYEVI